MNRIKLLTVALLALVPTAPAGEELGAEMLLPVHENRDAYWPGAAFGKDTFLVVWQSGRLAEGDVREGLKFSADIVGCRVDKSGKPLDAAPFVICKAEDIQEHPRVAFGGESFLVVWSDLRNKKDWDVYAARVSPDGKVLDPDGILVAGGERSQALPHVAWDGKAFVVTWQDLKSGKAYEVWAARVSGDGKVLDPQGAGVSTGPDHRFAPAVASSGDSKSFIFWSANRHGFGATSWGGGAIFADGAAKESYAFDPKKWESLGRKMGPSKSCNPLCATAGKDVYLAAWTTQVPAGRGNGPAENNCAIFDAEGKRTVDLMTLSGKPHHIVAPEAAWDGSAFVAAWAEQNAAQGKFPHDAIKATRFTTEHQPSGNVLAVAGTPEAPAKSAAVTSDGAGLTLIAYEKHPERAEVPIAIGFRMLTGQ